MNKLITVVFGVFFGIYLSQNYNIPNIKYYCDKGYEYLKDLEEQNRK